MTLWMFGDSFAMEYLGETRSYFDLLSEKLDCNIINKGLGATGLEYTFDQFNQNRNDIKDGDYIIVTLTDLERSWLFRDRPQIANDWGFKYLQDAKFTRAEKNAYEHWVCYLNNPIPRKTGLINFLYNLELLARQKKVNIIVLFCFYKTLDFFNESKIDLPNLIICDKVPLAKISEEEYDQLWKLKIKDIINDGRSNHLIRSNHAILSEKLYEVLNDRSLDINDLLSNGFIQGVFTEKSIKDTSFRERELFFEPSFIFY